LAAGHAFLTVFHVGGRQRIDDVEVRLPPAIPALYLRWVAFLRTVESAAQERPPGEQLPTRASVDPFALDEMTAFVTGAMIPSVRRQAFGALTTDRETVAPLITAPRALLSAWLDRVEGQARWLGLIGEGPERLTALGLKALGTEMQVLFDGVLAAVADAVGGARDR
jgi:hypothetical protein